MHRDSERKTEKQSVSEMMHRSSPSAERSGKGVRKGDHISHTKFGEGIVVNVQNGIAQIAFPYPAGIKKISAVHPSLKVIHK